MAGGGAILFLLIVIVMAISCRHLTARRNQPTMAYYSPHSAHYPNGGVQRAGVTPKLTVWVEKGDGNSYWWDTRTKSLKVCLQMATSWWKSSMKADFRLGGEPQRTLPDAWIRMHPDEPNTSIFLLPRSVPVPFFLWYWQPCLSVLSLFTTSSQLILIWRDLLQRRICIQPNDGRQAKRKCYPLT